MKELVQLCRGLNCRILGNTEAHIKGIAFHSQKIKPGYLFVAIDGYETSGNKYIESAIKNGAQVIATNNRITVKQIIQKYRNKITTVLIKNPRQFLSMIANRFFDLPSQKLILIGITGTDGKTTTSYMIKSILEASGKKVGLIGTIKYFDGQSWFSASNTTPESLEFVEFLAKLLKHNIHYCISEVSSHALALDRVAGLKFRVAVFTNLGHDHLDFHKTQTNYSKAKLKLFQNLSQTDWAVINYDDKFAKKISGNTRAKIIGYSLNKKATITAKIISLKSTGIEIIVYFPSKKSVFIKLPMIGRHNVYNMMAAIGATFALDVPQKFIKIGIENLKPISGRLEHIKMNKDFDVYIDYAHTPTALQTSINTLQEITKGRLLVVFGCGGNRDMQKRPIMGKIATELADYVLITSDNPRWENPRKIIADIKKGINKNNYKVIIDREQAIHHAVEIAKAGDTILIAGKGHEEYQIIGNKKLKFCDKSVVLNGFKN